MVEEVDVLMAMADDKFQKIIQSDEVIAELQKEKYNPRLEFNQLMAILSKIFKIGDVVVQAITPAVWSFLYCIENAYTKKNKQITKVDTDVFMYILSNGMSNLPQDLILESYNFCQKKGLNYKQVEYELKDMIYLMFRPLEMFNTYAVQSAAQVRFNADWLTKLVAVICPLTNKKSEQVMFNMSLTECFYYMIQNARKYDDKNMIKRKNSDEIEAEIYRRTLQLGKKYYEDNYKNK